MNLNLDGKTAIVTGASQGIGKAITLELVQEGVRVLAVARNQDLLNQLQLEANRICENSVIPVSNDLLREDAAIKIADKARSVFNNIDILVNNAGTSAPMQLVDDNDKWNQSMTLEFHRPRQLSEKLLPQFIERESGVILNLISSFELQSLNASAVAKAALVAWSKQLSWQVGKMGIRINCLQPGLIDTENIRRFFSPADRAGFAEQHLALDDFGSPGNLSAMAAFLVSPRAAYITGTISVVDGGMERAPY